MADRHCIFAWTEPNAPEGFPGYVNISRDENGKHTITVRSRGNAGRDTASVEIPPEALESLLCDLSADLYRDDPPRGVATHTNTDPAGRADWVGKPGESLPHDAPSGGKGAAAWATRQAGETPSTSTDGVPAGEKS